jgi:NarL family two-component system response regulator LiaR
VDDHAVVRQGLRSFLEVADGINVIGEAGNGRDGVELARQLRPDVALLDLVMPSMDGIEATRQIKIASPTTNVIVLTSYGDDAKVFPAIKAGAISYLLKDIRPEDLVVAIHAAKRGEATLAPAIATKIMREFAAGESRDLLKTLSEREVEVLREVARGRSNKEISANLKISEKTVKTHVSNILDKLHVDDRTKAALFAWKNNIGNDDDPSLS